MKQEQLQLFNYKKIIMSNISGKLNLLNLYAVRKMLNAGAGPIECIVIPIEKNKLVVGEKGVYLDLIAFELEKKSAEIKQTHLVKQSFSKDVREKMTEEELKAQPILGNLLVWGERQESEPRSPTGVQGENDDLPF